MKATGMIGCLLASALCLFTAGAQAQDLYVGSNGNGEILHFDVNDITNFGNIANVTSPRGLAFAPDGTLYIANGTDTVLHLDSIGNSLGSIDMGVATTGLAFGSNNLLYGTSYADSEVFSYNPLTLQTTTLASVDTANGITVANNGDLYVTSFGSNELVHLDSSGTLINQTDLGNPGYGEAFGADGDLYVSDTQDILKVDPNTLAISTFIPAGTGGLSNPYDVKFGYDGLLYVTSGDDVLRYDPISGAYVDTFIAGVGGEGSLDQPIFMAFGPVSPADTPEPGAISWLVAGFTTLGGVSLLRRRRK